MTTESLSFTPAVESLELFEMLGLFLVLHK